MDHRSIDGLLDTLPEENRENVISTMQKYGENRWWQSQDPIEIARYQIFEPILMVPFGIFHEGIEKLLGRPVYTHEFGLNYEGLKREAENAIGKLERGENLDQTKEYQGKKVLEGFQQLIEYSRRKAQV